MIASFQSAPSGAEGSGRAPLTLYELNALVRRSLEHCLPDEYWVQAELSDVRTNSTGHCYLEFVQKDPRGNQLIAKARATIWSNVFRLLKPYFEESTGQAFASGIKVLVQVTVSFHELYGYSLTVQDIDPTYTLGDLARRRREILKQLEEEGVLTLNKELEMPPLPRRIAVISSPTAAGYGDFCHQLAHNPRGFFFHTELFPALMQGDRVEESVLAALDRVNVRRDQFDVVVIIRGGGATSDLSGFDTYLLAAACAQFPLPIITGIGHERDDTVLDSVAHTRVKTPTAAAEYLIACMTESADELAALVDRLSVAVNERLLAEHNRQERLIRSLGEAVRGRIGYEQRRLFSCQQRIPASTYRLLSAGRLSLLTLRKDLSLSLRSRLSAERHRLELLQQRLKYASPEKLLARGYTITLKEGKIVKEASQLEAGDRLVTRFRSGETVSVVAAVDCASPAPFNSKT